MVRGVMLRGCLGERRLGARFEGRAVLDEFMTANEMSVAFCS